MEERAVSATVLVAEDDDDLLELMTVILEGEGYQVRTARNGAEALAQVRVKMPDLILLDMKMPHVSGWEFATQYVQAYPPPAARAPVVVVTAAEHTAARAQEISASGYLAKPFTHGELLTEVRRFLRSDGPAAKQ